MARPSTTPTRATDAAYSAPGDPWNSGPTRVQPSAGKRAQGWEPTETPPAEWLNWWQGVVGDWIEHLAVTPLANLVSSDISAGVAGGVMAVAHDPVARSGRGITVAVIHGPPTTAGVVFGDGETWEAAGALPSAPTAVYDVASDGAGLFVLVGLDSGPYIATSTDGETWVSRTPATSTFLEAVVYEPVSGNWIAAGGDGRIETSPDGTTWTARTPGFATAATDVNDLAVDPATGIAVAVCQDGSIWRSIDGGVNWTDEHSAASALRGVAWSPGAERFVAVGGALGGPATVLLSADGVTWTAASGLPALGTAAAAMGVAADDGHALVLTLSGTGFTGYAWSTDGGDTWSAGRAREDATQPLVTVSRADGRWYLGAGATPSVAELLWATLRTES